MGPMRASFRSAITAESILRVYIFVRLLAHMIAEFDLDRAGLQVGIERVNAVAEINDDVIAAHRFQRDGHGA